MKTKPSHRSRITIMALLAATLLPAHAAMQKVSDLSSPDGKIAFTLERDDSDGRLVWSVAHAGRPVVSQGSLGIEIAGLGKVGGSGEVTKTESREVDSEWIPVYGEQSKVVDKYKEVTLTISDKAQGELAVRLQVRAYDEGVALRYLVDGPGRHVVKAEQTSFPLSPKARVWVTQRTQGPISGMPIGSVKGNVARPVTGELAPDLFFALGEAGQRDHARMTFTRSGDSTLIPSLAGDSSYEGSFATPWRFVRCATSAAALLQGNSIVLNLNEPTKLADTSWIRPGKVLREVTLTDQGSIASIDWAAAHGIEFVMYDAGWYGNEYSDQSDATTITVDPKRSDGPLDLREMIKYAKSKGVGVILYVNRRALEKQVDEVIPLFQEWGVAGIKFGFVRVGDQKWTQWLHDSIENCAKHQLMANVHDEYRMTGVERSLPNFMTSEGIRGDEESPKNEDVIRTIFTRGLVGAGDQTNCYFAERVPKMGSHASQLAKSVCIYSPWQHLFWYDRPQGSPKGKGAGGHISYLEDVPEMSFFTRLPTVWDETRWIGGHPESHAVVARRKGDTWFLGAINGTKARDFKVPLDFLTEGKKYQLEVFSDDPAVETTTQVKVSTSSVDHQQVIERQVAPRNGFAAIISPE